jgi:ornithine cyclodeaminase/alanine dehydrogenase-like protein (mu-crystallin family)
VSTFSKRALRQGTGSLTGAADTWGLRHMHTTILTASDVRDIVHRVGLDALMDETIRRLDQAFADFDPENVVVPARDGFHYQTPDMGLLEWMPGMRAGESAHIKVVGYHPNNGARHDLPTILSTLSMYGVSDGHLRGMMDATLITALRTGAASAVASRVLAQPDASALGLIGCGAQAVTQLHALSRVFNLSDVYIYDMEATAVATFADRARCLGLEQLQFHCLPPRDFLAAIDILCTATSVGIGQGPVFSDQPLKPDTHINAIGSDFPGKVELPRELLARSFVCPDFGAQAIKEGECQQLDPADIGPDIYTLVKNQSHYQANRQTCTVFDSTGWALEDMVCMDMFMEYAASFEIGRSLQLESVSSDCLNPYQFLFEAPAGELSTGKNDKLKNVI